MIFNVEADEAETVQQKHKLLKETLQRAAQNKDKATWGQTSLTNHAALWKRNNL